MTATVLNTKRGKVDNKIPDTSGWVTTTALNKKTVEVENKTPDFRGLVKKTDYNAKILDIETKYFPTSDYNKFTMMVFNISVYQPFNKLADSIQQVWT